jgi:hypothetical protein
MLRILSALCLSAVGLFAQSAAVSQISGTVRDSGGLVVPDAQITITQTATGLTRTVQTSAQGDYTIPSLPVGPYKLSVTKQGFESYVQEGIVLQVSSNPVIDATLKIGSVNQQVVVEADASMVETHSSGVGQVVDQERVVDLPLNGRNALQLVFLAGGATTGDTGLNSSKNYPTLQISVAGGSSSGIAFMLDGANHNDPYTNYAQPIPFPDALQEFKVETSALPAQYGYHAAAAVSLITKSGSNSYNGDAFEFFRNGDLNARNFFAPTRDSLKRNQFGGTFGGPIKKNKLFFFLGYQGTTQRSNPTTGVAFVPTADMLQGNFTAYASPACNGNRQITLKAPFVNNQISPSLFSAPALKLDSYLPTPINQCGQVSYGAVTNQNENLALGRVDYQLNDKHTVFFRYYLARLDEPTPYNNNDPLTITTAALTDVVQSFALGETYLIGSGTVNSFHLTYDRGAVLKGSPPFFSLSDLGVNATALIPKFSVVQVTGGFTTGNNIAAPAQVITNTPQIADDFSLIRGAHQLGFGVNFIKPQDNVVTNPYTMGLANFGAQFTGLALSDFLLGDLNTFTQGNPAIETQRPTYLGLYAQDSWKVSPRLTVSAGLRWEPLFPVTTKSGFVSHFDPTAFAANVHSTVFPQAPAGSTYPGDPGFPGKSDYFGHMADFAPRLGVVLDPRGDGKMTIRAAYGIFYDLPPAIFDYAFSTVPPYGETVALNSPAGGFANPWAGYPGGNPFPTQLGSTSFFPTGAGVLTTPLHVSPTYLQQWNLSIQRQIGANWMVAANYIGNETTHLWSADQINPAVYIPGNCTAGQYGLTAAGPCSSLTNIAQRRALTLINPTQGAYYAGVGQLDDGATASYNGLLLSAQRRMSHGVTILTNYTWSHCITEPPNDVLQSSGSTMYPSNLRADRGNCPAQDRRHVLNISAVAQTPKFSERWLQTFAGNWQYSAIVTAQSGNHFNVTTGVDNALSGQSNERPNLVGNPVPSVQTVNQWLVASAFASPAPGSYGNLGINSFVGPGGLQFDTALSRIFAIREKQKIELRGEAFNILNRANFMNPTATLSSGNFGKILTANDPRILQIALKLMF